MKSTVYLRTIAMMVLAVILLACSSKNAEIGNLIPKDVGLLISLDMKSFNEKGKLADFNKTKMYGALKGLMAMGDPSAIKTMEEFVNNPEVLGLNLKSTAYYYMTKDMKYGGLLIEMKDKAKFQAYLKAQTKDKTKPEPEKIGDYLGVAESSNLLAWNDKVLYMMIATEPDTKENLINQFKKYTSLKSEESLTANENYKSFSENQKDISMWMDLTFMNAIFDKAQMYASGMNFNKLKSLFNGTNVFAYADFATDEIVINGKTKYGENIKKLVDFEKIYKQNVSKGILSIVPSDVIMVAATSIDMNVAKNGITEMFKIINEDLKPAIDNAPQGQEIMIFYSALEKYISKFNGEIVYALTDITKNENPNAINLLPIPQPVPGFLLLFGVNDNTILEQLVSEFKATITKVNDYYEISVPDANKFYFAIYNNILVATNDFKTLEYAKAGTAPNNILNTQYKDKLLKGNFAYINIDVNKYPQGFKSMTGENPMIGQYFSKLIFDVIEIETDVKTMTSTCRIKFKKSNTNSFLALIKMIDSMI